MRSCIRPDTEQRTFLPIRRSGDGDGPSPGQPRTSSTSFGLLPQHTSPLFACPAPHQLCLNSYRVLSARDEIGVIAPVPTMSILRPPHRMRFADEREGTIVDGFLRLTALYREADVASHVLDGGGTLAALNTHSMSIGTSFLQWIAVLLSNRAGWAQGLR